MPGRQECPQLEAPDPGGRVPGRECDGFVQAGALEHVEAGDLLLGLRERAVADQYLAVTDGGLTSSGQF